MTENQTTADDSRNVKSEAVGAGESDFEKLIKSFDEPTKTESNRADSSLPDVKQVLQALKPVHDFALNEKVTRETQEVENSIKEIVEFMTEPEETKELPKRFVRGFLAEYSREHPEIQDKYLNRKKSPDEWSKTMEQARQELLRDAKSLPRDRVASDVRAAKAAVQGATQKAAKTGDDGPSILEMANMPEHEWEQYKAKLAGAARK